MAKLYLIRHAEPGALWGSHPDPGLSELGQAQARTVGQALALLGISNLITSPLARCQETARPLEAMLGTRCLINKAVAEIPVPKAVTDHRSWLMAIMNGAWRDDHVDPMLRQWRDEIGVALKGMTTDTIIFSHFVAINAAVGIALGQDKVTSFKPGHASVTILESAQAQLSVLELGQESAINLA
jgi:broad specificity phosphatase PhoE